MDVVIALHKSPHWWVLNMALVTFAMISGVARSGAVLTVILLRSGSQGNMHNE